MNILEKIVQDKKTEIAEKKKKISIEQLEKSEYFGRICFSMKEYILNNEKYGIIAEFKRKSPSKGIINHTANIEQVTKGYVHYGASAISVLTDEKYFGGSINDLQIARKTNQCPILRKEFIIDEYQIIEAKSIGADAILLIATILSSKEVLKLSQFAKSIGLEILLELHDETEVDRINSYTELVGINNRNLKNFAVDINQSIILAASIPDNFIKIAESGISNAETLIKLKNSGFQGFLMGERFMSSEKPEEACNEFIKELKNQLTIPK